MVCVVVVISVDVVIADDNAAIGVVDDVDVWGLVMVMLL